MGAGALPAPAPPYLDGVGARPWHAPSARRLAIYGDAQPAPRQQYDFPEDVVFAQASSDGRQLLVVTADQTAYWLAVPPA